MKDKRRDTSRNIDFGLMTPAARVVDEILAIDWDERVLVVHDHNSEQIGRAFEHAALERRAIVERIDWEGLAPRPWQGCPAPILEALAASAASILVVSTEEGEYDARHAFVAAVAASRVRHVHIVGTSRRALLGSITASSSRVFELTEMVRKQMRPQTKLVARNPAGTSLEVEMAPHLRWFKNGDVVRAGTWINVPYGALVTSPHTANGVYVADAALGGGLGAKVGLLTARPIRLNIEAGRVRSVECPDMALKSYVERFIADGNNRDRIGLLSLGTNIGIQSPLGEIVHDENMPGLHVALGDAFGARTGATWSAHGQLAFAHTSGDLDLDGEPIVRSGRYVRFV